MLQPHDKVLVAVSGGIDSVVLMHTLFMLQKELEIHLLVCHLNHMFRGEESRADATWVSALAQNYQVPCYVQHIDVPAYQIQSGYSAQMAARKIRYHFYQQVLQATAANKLALGHHADDQAETVLMNVLKGAGLSGLKGIPPVRDYIVRPLLESQRCEIHAYCQDMKLQYREDASNHKLVYMRNRVRMELIPCLQQYNPLVMQSLNRLSKIVRDEDEYLQEVMIATKNRLTVQEELGKIILSLEEWNAVPVAIQRRICREIFKDLSGAEKLLTYEQTEKTIMFLGNYLDVGKMSWPNGILLWKRYGCVEFTVQNKQDIPEYCYPINIPGRILIEETGCYIESSKVELAAVGEPKELPSTEVLLDFEVMQLPLFVRRRREGDLFWPLGLQQPMKLKKFLINRKIPQEQRDLLPLVVCGEEIAWVGGVSPGEKFKVTEHTKTCIYLKIM